MNHQNKSKLLDELYGVEIGNQVFERLRFLDPDLNDLIQNFAYDTVWARPGLSLRDKSLVTVAALFALKRGEQTRIHLQGFRRCGGERAHAWALLTHISGQVPDCQATGKSAIDAVFGPCTDNDSTQLSPRDQDLASLASAVPAGDQLPKLLRTISLPKGDIRAVFIHLTVYCGFPAAMAAFAALSELEVPCTSS